MTYMDFRNTVCRLLNVDRIDLVDAGVLDAGDLKGWRAFEADPVTQSLRLPTDRAARLWSLVAPKTEVSA